MHCFDKYLYFDQTFPGFTVLNEYFIILETRAYFLYNVICKIKDLCIQNK